jgi:hypothetical protein
MAAKIAWQPRRSSCCDVFANAATIPRRFRAPRRIESVLPVRSRFARDGLAHDNSARMILPALAPGIAPPQGGTLPRRPAGDRVEAVAGLGKSRDKLRAKGSLVAAISVVSRPAFFGRLWRKRYIKAMPPG